MKFLLYLIGLNADCTSRFCFYYGGRSLGGGDKNSTNSTSTTDVTTTNQQTGASEGSFAVGGSGNSVQVESLDPQLVDAAAAVIKDSLSQALGFADQNQKSANDLIKTTNTDFTTNLIKNSGIADSTLSNNIAKYVTYGAIALFAVAGIAIFATMKKK